ncbi:MAG TPA: extracellular solute-binding protein [Actinotalea caeni]|uniref:ABC transporter substrate-binding protein n=1 Tax=Actinotalea caeni TaxID=1348467 RepID=UPI002B4B941F|nr:extracellular solute-binding protein [Actinotalea caeni]HLV56774.1 extracellular solute-binding protein [Actinotalea caeni]
MALTRRRMTGAAALAAAAVVLTACSSGGDGGQGTDGPDGSAEPALIDESQMVGAMEDYDVGVTFQATEPIDFSLLYRDHPNYPVQEDWSVFQHLEEDQGVTFDLTVVPLADWDQKKALLVSAGDAPEIISVTYPGQETQFVSGGALLPVSDYFEYMPNFTQKVQDWGLEAEIETLRQSDGKIYMLPGIREVPDVQYTVVIREDLFENAGITEDPATWDEFAEQLAAVKEANPELSYAMSDRWTDTTTLGSFLNVMAPTFGTSAGWGYSNTWYDHDAGEFVFTGGSDAYRDLLTYAHGLVEQGLLDPEVTQSDDQAVQKFVSGDAAAISGNTQVIAEYRTKLADAGVDAPIRLITIPDGPYGSYLAGSQLSSGLMLSSEVADSPNLLALLQFLDWLYYSDEGIEFAQWGVEGETYTRAEDGTRTLLDDIGWNALNPDAERKLNTDFGYSNGVFLLANGSSQELLQSVMTEEIATWTEEVLASKEIMPVAPAARLDEMELETTSLLDSQLRDAVQAATAAFITGQRPLSDWDAYVAEMEGLGATQLVDTYNAALARQ